MDTKAIITYDISTPERRQASDGSPCWCIYSDGAAEVHEGNCERLRSLWRACLSGGLSGIMTLEDFLERRGVREPCETCRGYGRRMYADTSTWRRGGMAGQSCTWDVCDVCWGSGDKNRKGVNLREVYDTMDARVAERALTLLADRAGTGLEVMHPAVEELVKELRRLSNGRKERPRWFHDLCASLARTLEEGLQAQSALDKDAKSK